MAKRKAVRGNRKNTTEDKDELKKNYAEKKGKEKQRPLSSKYIIRRKTHGPGSKMR